MVPTLSNQGPNPVVPTLPVVEVNVPLLEVAATYASVRLGADFASWTNEEAKKSMEVFSTKSKSRRITLMHGKSSQTARPDPHVPTE